MNRVLVDKEIKSLLTRTFLWSTFDDQLTEGPERAILDFVLDCKAFLY